MGIVGAVELFKKSAVPQEMSEWRTIVGVWRGVGRVSP
jgi:hypothetical protein